MVFYYIDASVLLKITSNIFSISSLVKISITSFTAFCINQHNKNVSNSRGENNFI